MLRPAVGYALLHALREMEGDLDRNQLLRDAVGCLLTDVFYTWLLALDGSVNFGGRQRDFQLLDEDGIRLNGGGNLESAAFEVFHGNSGEV